MSAERKEIEAALSRRLMPEPEPEDPRRCELHRFLTTKALPFRLPESGQQWESRAGILRKRLISEVYMRGHPPELIEEHPRILWREVIPMGEYRIRKLLYEGFPGLWVPALLYEPSTLSEPVPGVLNPNGHHTGGKSMEYKQARCINIVKRGMLALNTEFIGMGELTMNLPHDRIAHTDLCGKSGVGIFYLAVKRGLDVLLAHPRCDHGRVAMTGLSGGGWQTAVLSALDERIKVTIPVAGHSPVWQRPSCASDIGDLEQAPVDLCAIADYDTLTALFAPRPTLLIYNKMDDCCFRSERTRVSVFEPVEPLFDLLGAPDNIEFYENVDPGTHNYESDNRSQLYRFLNKHFGLETPEHDLPYRDEILSESQLKVGLPQGQASLLSLALDASSGLPVPGTGDLVERRRRLAEIIHLARYSAVDEIDSGQGSVTHHRLLLDGTWTIPATVFAGAGPKERSEIFLSDGGRWTLVDRVLDDIHEFGRLVAVDVFGTGESSYPAPYQMLVSSVGERPLGILVGQILSILQWASGGEDGSQMISASGQVTSFAALCSAAIEPENISGLWLDGLPDSLRRLIEIPAEYQSAVPLFCFGLLREFDVPQILEMTMDIPIERPGHGPVKPLGGSRA